MLIPIFPMFQYQDAEVLLPRATDSPSHSPTMTSSLVYDDDNTISTEELIATADADMLMTLDECDRLATDAVVMSSVSHIYKAAWDLVKRAFRANTDEQTQRTVLMNLAMFTYDAEPMTQVEADIWAVGYGAHLDSSQIEQVANYGLVFARCDATFDRDTETQAFLDRVTHSYMRLLACTPEIMRGV